MALSRNQINAIKYTSPPVPIFTYVERPDESGVVMRYMFPFKGMVTKAAMYVENCSADVMMLSVKLGGLITSVETSQSYLSTTPDLLVAEGQRLEVKVSPADKVSGVWVALAYQISPELIRRESALAERGELEHARVL